MTHRYFFENKAHFGDTCCYTCKIEALLKDKWITEPASMSLWCLPVLSRPIQALINHLKDDLIQEEDYEMVHGGVKVPDRPGLGVTLDNKAVEKYRTDKGIHPL